DRFLKQFPTLGLKVTCFPIISNTGSCLSKKGLEQAQTLDIPICPVHNSAC
ncbi:hypothetical protein KI387_002686, partial [Taxus chinensis]